jgi:hypothetical protein
MLQNSQQSSSPTLADLRVKDEDKLCFVQGVKEKNPRVLYIRNVALGSTQPLTEYSGSKGRPSGV